MPLFLFVMGIRTWVSFKTYKINGKPSIDDKAQCVMIMTVLCNENVIIVRLGPGIWYFWPVLALFMKSLKTSLKNALTRKL